jgi:multidrug efflux pump subunit AcrB
MEDLRIRNPTFVTVYAGATAERVEALVTRPIEDDLREIAEIKEIRSDSRPGVSGWRSTRA